MSGFSRSKGKRAEREVVVLLQSVVIEAAKKLRIDWKTLPRLQRNAMQSDGGGYDIVGLDFLAPEVKRCEKFAVPAWWRQTLAQAKPGQTPVLFYRRNREDWNVLMRGQDTPYPATDWHPLGFVKVDMIEFRAWLANRLLKELRNQERTNV